jgi:TfoX/Sxy family transcriptional regulator of competence genes
METLTTNTQATLNYYQIASDIVDVMEKFEFTTELPIETGALQNEIVNAIRNRLEGKTNHAPITGQLPL